MACIDIEFFYFGLQFYWLKTKADDVPQRITFDGLKVRGSDKLKKTITDDMTKLRSAKVGQRQGYRPTGTFLRLAPRNVYVYKHVEHVPCSSVHLSQVQACLVTNEQTEELAECTTPEHNALLPFFYKNEHLLRIYKQSFRNGCLDIKPEIDKLEGILNGLGDASGTPYEAPLGPATGWQENDWTKRLIHGIQVTLPGSKVTYTASMGTTWTTNMLPKLGVKRYGVKEFFLFRGAPDVIINREACVVHGESGQPETLSSEEDLIENSYQRPQLVGADVLSLPEKTGEVIAGLHLLLVSRILRKMEEEKPVQKFHKVSGLLIDKIGGTVLCELSVDFKEGSSPLTLLIRDFTCGLVTPNYLCTHLKNLMQGPSK